ncbi:MAG: MBL fold metallo-hydrolase [Bacteroidetes bacterium]|nr:MBL fold metallo-hydrolase [Bacteroidota bacterium]
MKLYSINAGHFKLDGGAMFGVVPKSIWNKLNPSDENNMCSWAMRCLLIEKDKKLILIDTGMGNKQNAKFFSYYYLHGNDSLSSSLQYYGFTPDDITDVVLTHLHFDHCGGAATFNETKTRFEPFFKNANYYTTQKHYDWAINPNAREKASFLKENILPLQESGQLHFIDENYKLIDELSFYEVFGHTESMMLPIINYKHTKIIYLADLIPSAAHIPLPYVMSYDLRPLNTLKEKEFILNKAIEEDCVLFFEHDKSIECAKIIKTERGYTYENNFLLSDL